MTGLQKFIKYVAIAFGIYLSITIVLVFLGIARGLVFSSQTENRDFTTNEDFKDLLEGNNVEDVTKTYENIKNLEIDLEVTELIIKNGDTFKIEGTNIPNRMEINQEGNKLKITDEKVTSSYKNEDLCLTIYIPENQKLDKAELEMKYMSVDIEKLEVTNLKLDMYSNYCTIDSLIADNIEIDNEYGDIDIYHCETKIFKLDSESGLENIGVKVMQNAEFDVEYSDTNITLIGTQETYQVNSRNQLGTVYISQTEIPLGNETLGTGNIKIDLKSKSATVYIEFEEMTNESYL